MGVLIRGHSQTLPFHRPKESDPKILHLNLGSHNAVPLIFRGLTPMNPFTLQRCKTTILIMATPLQGV